LPVSVFNHANTAVGADGVAYVTDIIPTILEMTGVELPARFEGRPAQTMIGRSLSGVIGTVQVQIMPLPGEALLFA
jgi:hypothetical protein